MKNFKLLSLIVSIMLVTVGSIYSQAPQAPTPDVPAGLYNDGKIDYATSAVKFNITAEDALSAVKTVFYRIDKGAFAEYTEPISIAEEGLHTIYYYSADNVGNESEIVAYTVIIDNTPPDIGLSQDTKLFNREEKLYAPLKTKYSLIATDELSGVKTVEYAIDGGNYTEYTNPFTIDTAGEHTIKYRATDNLGNVSQEKTLSVFVDGIKPEVKIIPGGEFFKKEETQYALKGLQYQIEASDVDSGIASILVAIDGAEFIVYEAPISFEKEGEHTIVAKAVDNVGNVAEEVKLTFVLDATPPKVGLTPVK